MHRDSVGDHPEIKVLILGSSESGKSTLLKAMKLCQKGVFSRNEAKSFAKIAWSNTVQSTRAVLEAMKKLEIPLQNLANIRHAHVIFTQPAQIEGSFPPELELAVTELWADPGFQKAYRRRSEYQVLETLPYFASHVKRLAAPGYIPSQEDILRTSVKTTGITETYYEVRRNDGAGAYFRVIDVGGARSERTKWFHVGYTVDTIVFTVDASAYCRLLYEDETVNRMAEQLAMWESITKSSWSYFASFLLIFTKIDCLPEQFEAYPVADFLPDFKQPESGSTAEHVARYLAYLEDRFLGVPTRHCRRRSLLDADTGRQ
ncbi:uncharacterized protein THITE_2141899 [Thermothielavioides terrestris NRRL 8126]|uniref:Uncharacterized protein n=1 Tax=Thermothielavioides terrestris (strain ATCC 38088 / NRRL 8126) TaxID=578455 RepID=G2QWD0_THETT|nr:uncharacterized protein THITE_2141899 [Thermothielavioides terrestris NRRL 8126]AEO63905.1 hypothetical protein THITE_2141899 [Thermothielavioides terrestris NRRL 8126]